MKEQIDQEPLIFEPWMRGILILLGVYSLFFGLITYNFQEKYVNWLTESAGGNIAFVNMLGLLSIFMAGVFVMGAVKPIKLWYFIVAGLIYKIAEPIFIHFFVADQTFTRKFIFILIMNSLVWIIPLIVATRRIFVLRESSEQP